MLDYCAALPSHDLFLSSRRARAPFKHTCIECMRSYTSSFLPPFFDPNTTLTITSECNVSVETADRRMRRHADANGSRDAAFGFSACVLCEDGQNRYCHIIFALCARRGVWLPPRIVGVYLLLNPFALFKQSECTHITEASP